MGTRSSGATCQSQPFGSAGPSASYGSAVIQAERSWCSVWLIAGAPESFGFLRPAGSSYREPGRRDFDRATATTIAASFASSARGPSSEGRACCFADLALL